jgi:DHA2 family multidrug resistance protein
MVLSPAGMAAVVVLLIVGLLLSRGVDARWLMATGLLTLAAGNFWMSRMNLSIAPVHVIWPRVVVIGGLSMIFAPLNVAAFMKIPTELRGAAVGLLALLRNEGGSVGTSLAQTLHDRREQFHTLRLNERLDEFNPALSHALTQSQQIFMQHTADPVGAREMALQAISLARERQALSLAFFDIFFLLAVLGVILVFFVLLMQRSVAEKGAHLAAE